MSVSDASIALPATLSLQEQAKRGLIIGDSNNGYPTSAQQAETTYHELSGAANPATVQLVSASEPPNLAAAAALLSQLTNTVAQASATAASAYQLLSAAETLTMTAA